MNKTFILLFLVLLIAQYADYHNTVTKGSVDLEGNIFMKFAWQLFGSGALLISKVFVIGIYLGMLFSMKRLDKLMKLIYYSVFFWGIFLGLLGWFSWENEYLASILIWLMYPFVLWLVFITDLNIAIKRTFWKLV